MVYSTVNLLLLCISFISSFLFLLVPYYWWISPIVTYRRLKRIGFPGPAPSFPFGNLGEMKKMNIKVTAKSKTSNEISHDIHATTLPFYARWQRDHGKVFIYWLGTEPFLYVADPEFLRKMSSDVLGKNWGKPTVFKKDRHSMFGRGLNMVEGEEWVLHRHIITPAFSPANIKSLPGSWCILMLVSFLACICLLFFVTVGTYLHSFQHLSQLSHPRYCVLGGFKTLLTHQAVTSVLFVETLSCKWLFDGGLLLQMLNFRISCLGFETFIQGMLGCLLRYK
ncbi:unnamed protein product [Rhodiola kirilowii]